MLRVQSGRRSGKRAPAAKKAPAKKVENPLFPARPRNMRIGGALQPVRDMSRFVRWPKYVRLQRQRKVLYQRLKVPPALVHMRSPLDKSEASPVFRLLEKYRPETRAEKKGRLEGAAEAKAAGAGDDASKPRHIKYGLNHVTYLIEQQKAGLVVIASDVDPVELVVWLPALCRKMGVPYVVVNNRGRLGTMVHKKKAAVLALCTKDVRPEDRAAFNKICENATEKFNNNVSRKWGGGIMGLKTTRRLEKREKALEAEAAKKALY